MLYCIHLIKHGWVKKKEILNQIRPVFWRNFFIINYDYCMFLRLHKHHHHRNYIRFAPMPRDRFEHNILNGEYNIIIYIILYTVCGLILSLSRTHSYYIILSSIVCIYVYTATKTLCRRHIVEKYLYIRSLSR